MKISLSLMVILGYSINLSATEVTLEGNNANPGFLTLNVGGTVTGGTVSNGIITGGTVTGGINYQSLDYTGQRFSAQNTSWNANLVTYDTGSLDLQNDGYYGPNDPLIKDANYLTLYDEEMYLFADLLNPSLTGAQIASIQLAVYDIFDPGDHGCPSGVNSCQSYLTAAQTNGTNPPANVNSFLFVDSPLNASPLQQGFIIETTPEPATMALIGLGLIGLAALRRVKSSR
jgi:hypothetical protein